MSGTEVTLDDLRRILQEAAGADENVDLDGDIIDVSFADLGYDSLALMETAARITQEFGIKLEDDATIEATSPRDLLKLANLAASGA